MVNKPLIISGGGWLNSHTCWGHLKHIFLFLVVTVTGLGGIQLERIHKPHYGGFFFPWGHLDECLSLSSGGEATQFRMSFRNCDVFG